MNSELSIYCFFAITSSFVFVIQFILSLTNNYHDDLDHDGALHFKWFSRQAATGFILMFGWTGITCSEQMGFKPYWTFFISLLAGATTFFITGFIFKAAGKLHSNGTAFDIHKTIGMEGVVYQRISEKAAGKITVIFEGHTHEIDAISENIEAIDSFEKVKIIKTLDNLVVVRRI